MPVGAASAVATSINEAGQIAGGMNVDGRNLAVLWDDGAVTEIGTLPGYDNSTNGSVTEVGHVVATAVFANVHTGTGFIWIDGVKTPLLPRAGDEFSTALVGSGSGLVIGRTSNEYEEPSDPRDEVQFIVWRDGEVEWVGDGRPAPSMTGNEAWVGLTEAGDGFMHNHDVGGLWRWRDGAVGGWPAEDGAWNAHAVAVSPGGLVLGHRIEDWSFVDRGVWNSEGDYFVVEDPRLTYCWAISDGVYVLCGENRSRDNPYLVKLDLGDGSHPDPDPEPGVRDLTIESTTATSVTLAWTQVGDGTGNPAWYRVKYAESPLGDWKNATIGCDPTIKGDDIGAQVSCTVTGLDPGTSYDFQLMSYRVEDGVWAGALYSNIATGQTEAGGRRAGSAVHGLRPVGHERYRIHRNAELDAGG